MELKLVFYSYEVLQYPLTDFIVEEEEPEQDETEEIREENEDVDVIDDVNRLGKTTAYVG